MSKLKKLLIGLLVVCFTVTPLFSCGASSDDDSSITSSTQSQTTSEIGQDDNLSKTSSSLSDIEEESKKDDGQDEDDKSSEDDSSLSPIPVPDSSSSETPTASTGATETPSTSESTGTSETPSTSEGNSSSSETPSTGEDNPSQGSGEEEDDTQIISGNVRNCVNVKDYGVEPNLWGVDQYDKFQQAIDTGKSIYVPAGYYYVSQSLKFRNQNLYGDGMQQTYIISITTDLYEPVICVGRSCAVEDIFIGYDSKIITGEETYIQRVGIITGDDYDGESWCLQRGSQINRVCISDVGTGILSADMNNREGYTSFSVSYTNLEIRDFSYRGIDFTAKTRTGNVFSNIYMNSKYEVDCLFNMEGEESETSITQLNLEHTKVKRTALSLEGCRALAVSTIHIEGIELGTEGASFVYIKNSAGTIESLTMYYCAVDANNCSLIEIGDGLYDIHETWQQSPPAVMSKLRIGNLHLKGIHDPNTGIHGTWRTTIGLNDLVGFNFIKRTNGAQGDYKVIIYNYVYYTYQQDSAKFNNFATSGNVSVVFPEY